MNGGRQDAETPGPEGDGFTIRRLAGSFIALSLSLAASRGLSIGSLLLFSWVSGPEPFAPFGLYIALVTVFWVAVFGCYEQAILVARAQDVIALAWLACAVAVGLVLILSVACGLAATLGLWLPDGFSGATVAVLCMPLSLALRAANRLALIFATREGEFAHVAKTNWVQAGVQGATQLLLLAAGCGLLALVGTARSGVEDPLELVAPSVLLVYPLAIYAYQSWQYRRSVDAESQTTPPSQLRRRSR